MIRIDKGQLEVNGTGLELVAELTIIMRDFLRKGIITEELLAELVENACLTDEQINAKAEAAAEAAKEFRERLMVTFLKNLFEGGR